MPGKTTTETRRHREFAYKRALFGQSQLKRLNNGPPVAETTGCAFLKEFRAHWAGGAPEVLSRCKEVIRIVLAQDAER
jgi:hypothetical protein